MDFKEMISIAGYGIETIGVLVIIAGSAVSSCRFLSNFRKEAEGVAYDDFRRQLGRSIILGLEFLIAGDIIRTVIVADTLTNVIDGNSGSRWKLGVTMETRGQVSHSNTPLYKTWTRNHRQAETRGQV